jgi:hypothetical protein
MNNFQSVIAISLLIAVATLQPQTSIKPASIYSQDGITILSPNQSGWTLLKKDESETALEKRGEVGILKANVRSIRTKTFETNIQWLNAMETLKQEELSKLKRDSIHFNYTRFKGIQCLQYDGIFQLEKASSDNFTYLNLEGYVCPHPNAKDAAIQIEFSNYSNTRWFTDDLVSLKEEFFEKTTFSKRH